MDTIKIDEFKGEIASIGNIEGDLTLPVECDDILKIAHTSCQISIEEKKIREDEIEIKGSADFTVYFLDKNNSPDCFSAFAYFNHKIPLSQSGKDFDFTISYEISDIKSSIKSSRTVSVKATANFNANLYTQTTLPCQEDEDLIFDAQEITGCKKVDTIYKTFTVKEDIKIPQGMQDATRLLSTLACPKITMLKTEGQSAIITGDINIITAYCASGEIPLWKFNQSIVFEELIDCDMSLSGIKIDPKIKAKNPEATLNEGQFISYEITLTICLDLYDIPKVNLIKDAYSISNEVNCKYRTLPFKLINENITMDYPIRKLVMMSEMEKPLLVFGTVFINNKYPLDDMLSLEGTITVDVIYQNEDGGLECGKYSVPLEENIQLSSLKDGMDIILDALCVDTSLVKMGENYEVRSTLRLIISSFYNMDSNMVESVEQQGALDMKRVPIIVYMKDEEENLYNIAKKFHLEENNIKEMGDNKLILLNALK